MPAYGKWRGSISKQGEAPVHNGGRSQGTRKPQPAHWALKAKLALAEVPKSTTAGGCHLTEILVTASLWKDILSSALPWLLWQDGIQLTSC